MQIGTRRKFGLVLVGASVLVAMIIQLATGGVVRVHTVRGDKLQSGRDYVVTSQTDLDFDSRY